MTTRCFVIGHPIAHSRSPLIHGAWIGELGLKGSYERIDVAPEALPAFIGRARAGEFAGGNVTVPHKEAVIPLLDEVSEAVRMIGAANTLWLDNGRLQGDNTDAEGFVADLDQQAPRWAEVCETALVLGAGGAARAIVYALKRRGVPRIVVVNRDPARASSLAAALGVGIEAAPWESREHRLGDAQLLVNTTSLGMNGQPALDIALDNLRPGTVVADIVYVPLTTALLEAAAERGAVTVNGLGMLLHQAVPGFERWFGVRPRVSAGLRALIEADIG